MIGMRIDQVKGLFFDKPAVIGAMDRATHRVMERFGLTTRLIAQRSIRKIGKSGKASLPGQPPKGRTGLLRQHIYAGYDPQMKSAIIGAALFVKSSWAQSTLEHGGVIRQKNRRRRVRKIGDVGEISLYEGKDYRTTKVVVGIGGEQRVTYTRLATQAQADRANRLNELIYGPAEIVAKIAPRPYMAPAFAKAKEKLPEFWENAISKM